MSKQENPDRGDPLPSLTQLGPTPKTVRAESFPDRPDLPPELWEQIFKLVVDNPCDGIGELCATNGMVRRMCEDGTLYEEASRRMGFYGVLPNWKAVQEHYSAQNTNSLPDARGYLRLACDKLREMQEELKFTNGDGTLETGLMETVINTMGHHPFATLLLGMVLERNGMWKALRRVPTDRADFGALAKIAVANDGQALRLVPTDHKDFGALAKIAVANDGRALKYVLPTDRADYGALAQFAVATNGEALKFVMPKDRADFGELARIAVVRSRWALEYVPTDRADYGALAELALVQNGLQLEHVPTDHADFGALARIAVAQNGLALQHVLPKDRGDFGALARIAVVQDGSALMHVPKDRVDYGEIARIAVAQNGTALLWVPKDRTDYASLEEIANET